MTFVAPERFSQIALRGWRNLSPLSFVPGARFNVISGDNGAGKSNLLEAIDYLATLESFRLAKADDIIGVGNDAALIEARVADDILARQLRIKLSTTAPRQLALDGKRPRSSSEWRSAVHTVLFHPGDVELPSASPERRRAFLDRILSQIDPAYASSLSTYTKALRSRNRLLKSETPNRPGIMAYDELLASAGSIIGQTRARLISDLVPLALEAFREISGEDLALHIAYAPRVEPTVAEIRKALQRAIDKDLARGFTADGPHADDLLLTVRTRSAKHHASQGQHRAMVLALKVAELSVLAARVRKIPVLLMDDVSSELDRAKNRRLFALLAKQGGQIFLTTTHPEFILLDHERTDFKAVNGVIK